MEKGIYRHLNAEERVVLMLERERGTSLRAIARRLGRNVSTLSREVLRNRSEGAHDPTGYNASSAALAYRHRRSRCVKRRKLVEGSPLFGFVHDHLIYKCWSPQQIAATLRLMHPYHPARRVSHETIYAAIYAHPRGALKKGLIEALRQSKPTRGRKRVGTLNTGFVPEALRIVHRPEQIETRLFPGHWEGDFIKGAFNRSAVGTLVERKTRFVVLCRMRGCTAGDALEGFSRQMRKLPAFMRQSLTYDRGSEMACHRELSRWLKLNVWFADPHAPWQRGSNENTNGLLRQFLPKGADLSVVSQTMLNDIARLLNERPRMTLGWKTPAQAMAEEMAKYYKTCCT